MKLKNDLPQVLTFAQVARGGKASLKKVVKQHLGGDAFYFDIQDEVLLTCTSSATAEPAEVRGSRMVLSESVMDVLGLDAGALLAMVQRQDSVALKAAIVEERPGDHARLVDEETARTLTRIVYPTPLLRLRSNWLVSGER